jgi:hypothetical protein
LLLLLLPPLLLQPAAVLYCQLAKLCLVLML